MWTRAPLSLCDTVSERERAQRLAFLFYIWWGYQKWMPVERTSSYYYFSKAAFLMRRVRRRAFAIATRIELMPQCTFKNAPRPDALSRHSNAPWKFFHAPTTKKCNTKQTSKTCKVTYFDKGLIFSQSIKRPSSQKSIENEIKMCSFFACKQELY